MIYYIDKDFLDNQPEDKLLDWMIPYKQDSIELSLLDYALQRVDQFSDSTTSDSNESYRKSKVLYILPEDPLFDWWSSLIIPYCEKRFYNNIQDLNYSHIEIQMTYHGESNYYKAHRDSEKEHEGTSDRVITFVYYFYIEPKSFKGGNLKLYSDDNSTDLSIEPISDSLITFLSNTLHEVTDVSFDNIEHKDEFKYGRFTINGWISYK